MPHALQITAATVDPALLDLPWEVPLENWPEEILAALPRGLSRHVVRFVNLSGRVMPYMPITLAGAAPQKVMVTVPPGATCEGSAITL